MLKTKSPVCLAMLSLATVSLNWMGSSLPTQAQVSSGSMLGNETLVSEVNFEPPNNGTLDRSTGGATRDGGSCVASDRLKSDRSVLPLMPENSQQGFTLSDRPTFFVYIPSMGAEQVFFTLKDKTEDFYYEKTVAIPEGGGIISVQLPEDAPALELGKSYQWTFVIACQMSLRPDSPNVSGWIERIAPESVGITELDSTPSLETAIVFGSAGIWFDTVATLAQLRDRQPEDYTVTWEKFLSSVGLEAIASQPLIRSEN